MSLTRAVVEAVEKATGETVEQLRSTPIDERRKKVERLRGKPMTFYRTFPFIGRGSIMGDKVISHAEVEREVTNALR